MSSTEAAPRAALGPFERGLSIWVAACIVVGVALGHFLPGAFEALAALTVARINLVVGVLIWVMIVPMLMRVDFAALGGVRRHWRGFGVTLFVNWAIKPFSMALLGWIFVRHVFAQWLPAAEHDGYIAGLILLAAAPCTAMVFVWSQLVRGEANFTLTQVALNDTIMVFAFAPIVALLLGVASITVPWDTLLLSVLLYILAPLAVAQLLRRVLARRPGGVEAGTRRLQPWSMLALLATLILLFGFQGEAILRQPLVIAMLAVPIAIQVVVNSALAYGLNRALGEAHCVAGPSALIGASNFFELAVAVAIALYGFESGAALATVVGVLIEVPLMLVVVAVVNRSRGWYERAPLPVQPGSRLDQRRR
jgi:ACR3 family arsenite transporter